MLKNRKKKGFTLIELIVVIAILGILAAVLIPRFAGFQDKARQTQALTDAKQVATAIDSFQAEHNAWPAAANNDEIAELSGVAAASGTGDGFTIGTNGGFRVQATVGDTAYYAARTGAASATSGTPGKVTVTD